MSPAKEAPSFDEIIQAGRQRAQNKALANEIFGRGRNSVPEQSKNVARKVPQPPTLASRITPAGVGKRSASASSIQKVKAPSRPTSAAAQKARINRIGASLEAEDAHSNISSAPKPNGISIRGISSGPFYITASNFARGTTAADIEAALLSVATGATEETLQYCRIITNSPTVIAEMSFTDRAVADQVISAFNGQKADGRILHVHYKNPPPQAPRPKGKGFIAARSPPRPSNPFAEAKSEPPPQQPPKELIPVPSSDDMAMDDVETSQSYDTHRSDARERWGAEPDFQDGNYGFTEPPVQSSSSAPINKEDPRTRDNGPSGGRDRDRDYDRDRDRDRERYNYRREDDRRGPPPLGPAYQGPRGGRGRGGWGGRGGGFGGGGGRERFGGMYSDDLMRGGGGRYSRGGGGGYR